MWLALEEGHIEAAKIMARQGADCQKEEQKSLGEKYTNFQKLQQSEQGRQAQEKCKEKGRESKG